MTSWKPRAPRAKGIKGDTGVQPRLKVQYHPGVEGVDEILRPTLLCIGEGSCYRLLKESWPWEGAESGGLAKHNSIGPGGDGGRKYVEDTYDEGEEPQAELEGLVQLPGGKYSLSLHIPSVFFKYIIGVRRSTQDNIEKDTKCFLSIPWRGQEGAIVINGGTVSAVAHAKRRVEMVAWTNRFKEEPTHFISIPLNCPSIREKFRLFKEQVLATCGEDEGVKEDAFKTPEKLHLTLGVMRIFSPVEEGKAIEILRKVLSAAKAKLGSEPVTISLGGLDCMGDDISAARVIYAKVNASKRLQDFVDEVNSGCIREGPELMRREFEREGVKLHATFMNAKFMNRLKGGTEMEVYRGMRREQQWTTINAMALFKGFGDNDFGEVTLTCLHLSERSRVDSNGYYKCVKEYLI